MSLAAMIWLTVAVHCAAAGEPLAGTDRLELEGDPAAEMVAGIDRYLMNELAKSPQNRDKPTPERLRKIIGVVDPRVSPITLEFVHIFGTPSLIAQSDDYSVHEVRWSVLDGVDAEGLGKTLGEQVRGMVGDEGKIVLGECVIGPEPHVLREAGFRAAFEGADIEWVGPVETICDATENYNNWQNTFTANQDAAAFVGLTAVETPSLGKLSEETGTEAVIASFDPGAEGLALMADGYIDVTVGQNPFLAGYMPVQAISRHVREGLEINPGVNLYPGEFMLPETAEELIEREGGGEPRKEWYRNFIEENDLQDFGLQ